MQEGIQYTKILHQPRIKAGLTCNEYVLASAIAGMQKNDAFPGWCYATKEWFSDMIGLSKRSVITLIFRLVELGFVEKNKTGQLLKVTKKWQDEIENFVLSEESSPIKRVKKVHQSSEESSLQIGEESSLEAVKKVHPIIILDSNSIDNDSDKNNSPNGVFDPENLEDYEKEIERQKAQELFEAENQRIENERIAAEKAQAKLDAKAAKEKEKKKAELPPLMFENFDKR